jgi:hypothetical protein
MPRRYRAKHAAKEDAYITKATRRLYLTSLFPLWCSKSAIRNSKLFLCNYYYIIFY